MTSHIPLSRLVLEEARALPRGRFALAGAAVLAGVLAGLGTLVAASIDGLWSFAILAYGFAPALLAAFAAMQVASLRTTRFGQALYTLPVRSRDVLAAKVIVGLGVGALYLLATLPFLAVAGLHVDVHDKVARFALAGAGLLAFAVAFGSMMGVLMAGRSLGAPVALSAGFVLLSFFAIPYALGAHQSPEGGDAVLLQALHFSPHLLASDAVGLTAAQTGFAAASPGRAFALLALETGACLAVAAWAYVRAQGPEGWEARPRRRAVLAGLALVALLVPAVAADSTYEPVKGHQSQGRGWAAEARNASVLLVPPGTAPPPFGDHLAGTGQDPLQAGRTNARDLLVLLPVEEGRALRDVRVVVEPGANLVVDRAAFDLGDVSPERGTAGGRATATWPPGSGAVLRVPLALTPTDPVDLTRNHYSMRVHVSFAVEGEAQPRDAAALVALRADVPAARLQMMLAGAPLLLLATTAAVARRVRVG